MLNVTHQITKNFQFSCFNCCYKLSLFKTTLQFQCGLELSCFRMCMVCLVKESKSIEKERKLGKLGIHVKERRHSAEAELFVDSSGISDSSAESSDEEEDWQQEESAHLIDVEDEGIDDYVDEEDNDYAIDEDGNAENNPDVNGNDETNHYIDDNDNYYANDNNGNHNAKKYSDYDLDEDEDDDDEEFNRLLRK